MQILETEVEKLKEILKQLLDDMTLQIAPSLKSEIQMMVDMPNLNGKSPQKEKSDVGFLAEIPLSPKECDSDGGNVSDLSSSYWSARISTKLDFEVAHEKHKLVIPVLDLTNLPPDSDDEAPQNQKNITDQSLTKNHIDLNNTSGINNSMKSHDISSKIFNQSGIASQHEGSRVMDLFA